MTCARMRRDMNDHKIKVPIENLPVSERRFYELWARRAKIPMNELKVHLLIEGIKKHGVVPNITFEQNTELERVMGLRPKMEDVNLTLRELVCDQVHKWIRTFKKYLKPRTRK